MYKYEVIKLYNELSKKYNCDFKLKFNNRKTQCGNCNYINKIIGLSNLFIKHNSDKLIKNTILHEIAHTLTKSGHDWKWRLKCKEIGCNGERINKEAIIPHKWIGICLNCKREVKRHTKRKVACYDCCIKYNNGKFDKKYLLEYKENI